MAVQDIGVVGCTPGAAGPAPDPLLHRVRRSSIPASTRWPSGRRGCSQEGFDGVLMMFGASGLDRQFDGEWLGPCDPRYNAWFQASFEANMRALQAAARACGSPWLRTTVT